MIEWFTNLTDAETVALVVWVGALAIFLDAVDSVFRSKQR